MSDNTGCLATIIFLLIVGLLSWQVIYAISQGAPQCLLARDVITCIEVVRGK